MFVALNRGMISKELNLMYDEENVGYIQRLDLGSPHTSGGTAVFKIRRELKSQAMFLFTYSRTHRTCGSYNGFEEENVVTWRHFADFLSVGIC